MLPFDLILLKFFQHKFDSLFSTICAGGPYGLGRFILVVQWQNGIFLKAVFNCKFEFFLSSRSMRTCCTESTTAVASTHFHLLCHLSDLIQLWLKEPIGEFRTNSEGAVPRDELCE